MCMYLLLGYTLVFMVIMAGYARHARMVHEAEEANRRIAQEADLWSLTLMASLK